MSKFIVEACIKFEVEVELDAQTEEEAKENAIEQVKDYYHLKYAKYHNPKDVKVKDVLVWDMTNDT